MRPLITLNKVTKVYGKASALMEALRGIDIEIGQGEFVAIMGPSGSGKSTCMNILGCLDTPTSGAYEFKGVEVGGLNRNQRALLRRHYQGFVFQGYNLLNRTSALENVESAVALPGRPRPRSKREGLTCSRDRRTRRLGIAYAGRAFRGAATACRHREGDRYGARGPFRGRAYGQLGYRPER